MTLREFTTGWMLLTAQPWGKTYRTDGNGSTSEPTPGDIQAEFYFQSVKSYSGTAWMEACRQHARGERWPSLDQLTQTMALNQSPTLKLAAPSPVGVSMEEALQERPDLLAVLKRVRA